MIYEYALEPSLLNRWPAFRYLSEKFGYSRGRVISRYPKHWERMVYESLADCPPVEKSRIEVALRKLKDALYPRYSEWKDGPWLENAIREHLARPFQAIIAAANPGGQAFVLNEADLAEETQPLWKVEGQCKVNRSPSELAFCAKLLLSGAREILFVDPHFDPTAARFRTTLSHFLDIVAGRSPTLQLIRIEYHTGHTSAGIKSHFDAECKARLPKCIPAGLKVRFVRWEQSHLHNRFILTDKGGLKFSNGLDECLGQPPLEDIVDLLADGPFKATWLEYQRQAPIFPLVEADLVVVGTRGR